MILMSNLEYGHARYMSAMATPSLFNDSQEILPFDGSAILYRRVFSQDFTQAAFAKLMDQTPWEQPEIVMFGKKYLQIGRAHV